MQGLHTWAEKNQSAVKANTTWTNKWAPGCITGASLHARDDFEGAITASQLCKLLRWDSTFYDTNSPCKLNSFFGGHCGRICFTAASDTICMHCMSLVSFFQKSLSWNNETGSVQNVSSKNVSWIKQTNDNPKNTILSSIIILWLQIIFGTLPPNGQEIWKMIWPKIIRLVFLDLESNDNPIFHWPCPEGTRKVWKK